MSGTLRQIQVGVWVEDSSQWTDQHYREWQNSILREGYIPADDWVLSKVEDAMREAAQLVISHNPDLFRTQDVT